MRILFLSNREYDREYSGGHQCTKRNYDSLCSIVGRENVLGLNLFTLQERGIFSFVRKWLFLFKGFYFPLNKKAVADLLHQIDSFDIVFIDSSLYGILAFLFKKNGYPGKIITFFHNVETDYFRQELRNKGIIKRILLKTIYRNEQEACLYSNELIVLNERDKCLLANKFVSSGNLSVIPISLKDKFTEYHLSDEDTSSKPRLLFLGSYFYANVRGINYFIDKVYPYVNIELTIVGKGMSKLMPSVNGSDIQILDYVEDLNALIKWADFMLFPIFEGGGMKVKTCEALMYGKNIIGTTESFLGYNVDSSRIGAICDSAEAFINIINTYSKNPIPKYNSYARKMFLDNFCFDVTLKSFKSLLNQ